MRSHPRWGTHRHITVMLLAALLGSPCLALATTEACEALSEARTKLLAMVDSGGRADLHALKRDVYAASARLEGAVGALRGDAAARGVAFRRAWEPFKRTREQEILPAIARGQYARARAIAYGIQAERYQQMRAALGCL